jgi:hypothetical protein
VRAFRDQRRPCESNRTMVTCDRRFGKQNASSCTHDSVEESRRTKMSDVDNCV